MTEDGSSPRRLPARAAERGGASAGVMDPGGWTSYAQLAQRTAALAATLRAAGVGHGTHVALTLPNATAFLVWYFGVLEAGGIVVPLPVDLPEGELTARMAEGSIPFLAAPPGVTPPLVPVAGMDGIETARLWRLPTRAPGEAPIPAAMIRQYSSGSTGRPKAMYKTDRNVAADYHAFSDRLGVTREDVILGVPPFCHAFGSLSFLAALHSGASLVVLPRFLPALVLRAALAHAPTMLLATPPMIDVLGRCRIEPGEEAAFQHLRLCICSTGSLSKAAHDAFHRRFGRRVHLQYGSTETLIGTVDLDPDFEEGRVGRPYPGVELRVLDERGQLAPPGRRGRVGLRSPAASLGYAGDPASSAATFQDGFVFPGDAGFLDERGRLHLLGRSDVLNIGGLKVDCLEVEEVIRSALPGLEVVVMAGERAGVPVVRAVVEADPATVSRSMVREACRERLAPHKVPALIDILPRLDRDANGKTLRARIPLGTGAAEAVDDD